MRRTAAATAALTLFLVGHLLVSSAAAHGYTQPPGARVPSRDPQRTASTGTASIRGHVMAADTKRPLRRARISVTAPELGPVPRTTSTNADGKFELKDLPAGHYTMTVNRSGYLQMRYGQRRPFEQGTPLDLADRQAIENIDFQLPRMSVITGRVYDETSEPMAGVRVMAMRSMFFEGRRRLVPLFGGPLGQTDDAGQYRVTALPPGSYYIVADSRETWTIGDGDDAQVMGYTPTYYPSVTTVTDAKRVTVDVGKELNNVDVALIPGRASTLSGTAFDSQGRPLAGRNVVVRQGYRGPVGGMFMIAGQATVASDGTFKVPNIPPGEYQLQVNTATDVNGTPVAEAAMLPVVAAGTDVTNLALTTSAGWSFSGSIVSDTGDAPSVSRDRIRVNGRVLNPDTDAGPGSGPPPPPMPGAPGGPGGVFGAPDSGRVRDDWTFAVSGLFGPVQVRVTVPDGWAVKSIVQDGRLITDAPVEMHSGEQLTGVQVVLTDKVSTVIGQLNDDQGAPMTDGTVIVFADSADKWWEDSRYVRAVRPDQQGHYEIKGLPAGEYLALAVDVVEEGMWNDPEYLESIRRYGQKVTISEGGSHSLTLKVVMR
jgi:protocatechuate 3,4-dioxygenase beta subunit